LKPLRRPLGSFGKDWVRVVDVALDACPEAGAAAVSGGNQAVADHAVAANALDWRSGEHLAERGVVERQKVG
jgi:hypothetical protein